MGIIWITTVKPCFKVFFVTGERMPFNRLNRDTPLIRALSMASSVSILTVFDCL